MSKGDLSSRIDVVYDRMSWDGVSKSLELVEGPPIASSLRPRNSQTAPIAFEDIGVDGP